MKNRLFTVILVLTLLSTLTTNAWANSSTADQPALVYVKLGDSNSINRFSHTNLPLYTWLDNGLLTGADQGGQIRLDEAGLSYQVLDSTLRPGSYYTAQTWVEQPGLDYSAYGQVLLNLDSSVVLRIEPANVNDLIQAGAEVSAITLTPKPLPTYQTNVEFSAVDQVDPIIQGMISQVTTSQIYTYDRQLAGELPVWVDGDWYTIPTRNTNSGIPIQKATIFVGQHMADDLGLNVEYYQWKNSTNPDVIGEIPGVVNPQDIFIIGAHIDDVSGSPGADDNGSGSVATLLAADILSQYQWGCTLRFAFWTGEEQGLLGSSAYAQHIHNLGENVLGYLNLDMIAWNTINTTPTIYLGYGSSVPPSLDLANLFADVVTTYNINLMPSIGTQFLNRSDHGAFINQGYPAILAIEGDDDFNPYYHKSTDTPAHTNLAYFTDFVKASIGTLAHMSNCLLPSGTGSLDGHVTSAKDGSPIGGARVIADDDLGHSYTVRTDESGYYTVTMISNNYAVTAAAIGYIPETYTNVAVTTNSVSTQDFTLAMADLLWLPILYK